MYYLPHNNLIMEIMETNYLKSEKEKPSRKLKKITLTENCLE